MSGLFPSLLLALAVGFMLPVQAGINSLLGRATESMLFAAAVNFVGGSAILLALLALARPRLAPADLATLPWWMWCAGLLGATFVCSAIVLVPRLGAATMVAVIVAGQMAGALLLDHWGMLGYAQQAFTPLRAVGAALIVAGVVLIQRH